MKTLIALLIIMTVNPTHASNEEIESCIYEVSIQHEDDSSISKTDYEGMIKECKTELK